MQEVERHMTIIRRGVVEIIDEDELREMLVKSLEHNRPLKVKLGLDPSAPDIHLGHTVVIQKLKSFQTLGHTVQLVIGDFTGRIGDPTGKSETRKQLTEEEVQKNAETYVEQFSKVLDMSKVEIHFNSHWLAPLTFADVVNLAAQTTVARMLERDDFQKRYAEGIPIALHEFFYPLMQGYDSVALRSDIELGGTDQKFNLLMGRTLKRAFGQHPQVVIMMPLLEGLDGTRKMSKSLGNYIGVSEPPEEMYGKVMSLPDDLMLKYFELLTDITEAELAQLAENLASGKAHPRDVKMDLARRITATYHGPVGAMRGEEHFRTLFQERSLPDAEDIEARPVDPALLEDGKIGMLHLLTTLKLVQSNSEARRMVQQGAVKIDGEKISDPTLAVVPREGMIVQVGKRHLARVTLRT
ncbi:MAG: tyrosine--tRNA ligase [Candidatus Carbobacillus altaicus]|nr:tyrosine--tRNA ligase [Candidatus Carbobacillus altaicus]